MDNRRINPTAEPRDEYRTEFDVTGEVAPSTAVVFAVSAVTGRDPRAAPPLSEVVDTAALDRLFRGSMPIQPERTVEVEFRYDGCTVTVHSDGWIGIVPVPDDRFYPV